MLHNHPFVCRSFFIHELKAKKSQSIELKDATFSFFLSFLEQPLELAHTKKRKNRMETLMEIPKEIVLFEEDAN